MSERISREVDPRGPIDTDLPEEFQGLEGQDVESRADVTGLGPLPRPGRPNVSFFAFYKLEKVLIAKKVLILKGSLNYIVTHFLKLHSKRGFKKKVAHHSTYDLGLNPYSNYYLKMMCFCRYARRSHVKCHPAQRNKTDRSWVNNSANQTRGKRPTTQHVKKSLIIKQTVIYF